jgi:hypothetical protein
VGIGIGALLAPRPALRALGFPACEGAAATFVTRLAGGRDVALGALAFLSRDDPRAHRAICLTNACVDACDAAVSANALARREGIDRGAAVGVLSASLAAATGAWVAARAI